MSNENQFKGREEQNSAYTVSSRKWVAEGSDVYVKEFTLAALEQVPWHHHSDVFDIFYCIEGCMTIEQIDIFSDEAMQTLTLQVGESVKVNIGTAHRPFNPGPGRLRFLLVQGVGQYDYIPYDFK